MLIAVDGDTVQDLGQGIFIEWVDGHDIFIVSLRPENPRQLRQTFDHYITVVKEFTHHAATWQVKAILTDFSVYSLTPYALIQSEKLAVWVRDTYPERDNSLGAFIVGDDPVGRIFYLGLNTLRRALGERFKINFFTQREAAVDWLRQQIANLPTAADSSEV